MPFAKDMPFVVSESKLIVELERLELSSKRGTNMLSTCLSSP